MKENNRKERVQNLGKFVIRGPSEQERISELWEGKFRKAFDRLSSHCIGDYLWVYSV
jgi:hypothetical protein